MKFNFDTIIDRKNTNALAIEGFSEYLFGHEAPAELASRDLIHMYVADMQFAAPAVAIDAMRERLEHPIFGYTMNFDDALHEAIDGWCQRRYGWSFPRHEMETSLGVIPALYSIIDCATIPGQKILCLAPCYGYFKHAADHHGRAFVTSDLRIDASEYRVDFDDFEAKARDPQVRIFFLCNPHNPTGRRWRDDELRRMGEICLANGVMIVSDEVHCDLLRTGLQHRPIAKLFPGEKTIVTCMAPSKTFNLAGLMTAVIVIPDPDMRQIWRARTHRFANPLGLSAATAVFRHGDEWLEALQVYLDENFAAVREILSERLPRARFSIPESTYLAWIDVGAYLPSDVNLTTFFLDNAGVILEGGEMFVSNGSGRIRVNVACPRHTVRRALNRICDAVIEAVRFSE